MNRSYYRSYLSGFLSYEQYIDLVSDYEWDMVAEYFVKTLPGE